MKIDVLNILAVEEAVEAFTKCCGAHRWVERMVAARPFRDKEGLFEVAENVWYSCEEADWLEAFTHHPKIGNIDSLAKKFANTKAWAGNEQKGVASASREVLERLAAGNEAYEKKFGFIFIVCATGKSAAEMLALLEARIGNSYEDELKIAMGEQHKITLIRLNKLLAMSQITTHVLDTAQGKPAEGIRISLQRPTGSEKWETITSGITNDDGRIPDFLPSGQTIEPGIYRMLFETGVYFEKNGVQGFYPEVPVIFEIRDTEHYHIPLLLNPFGYSTYRGS